MFLQSSHKTKHSLAKQGGLLPCAGTDSVSDVKRQETWGIQTATDELNEGSVMWEATECV